MGGPHVIKKRGKQEEENFKILFRDYFVSMCVFANRYLEDGEMARDVVMMCFVDYGKIHRNWWMLPT